MAAARTADRGTWSLLRILPFFFPVAFLYFLTPILNETWSSWILSRSDIYLGELARAALSEKSWLTSVEKRNEWMSANKDYDSILFTPRDESLRFWYTIWDLFPAAYTCPWDVQRVGILGDGGKWICGMSKYERANANSRAPEKPIRIYSFGIGDDSSFETEMLGRSSATEIYGFDDTVDDWGKGLEAYSNRTHFFQTAVAEYDYYYEKEKTEFLSIKSIMKKLGHEYVNLVKMDIEGDEFPTLESFLGDYTKGGELEGKEVPVGQMVIEIHVPEKGPTISEFAEWWERIEEAGFRPVWSEANLLAVMVGDGKPCCFEYTWINTKGSRSVLWERRSEQNIAAT
ncbi:methyltransferase domain-containing protein [Colletotrichum phormii]|uniref:Methyltransferase domain-containing protein n=1 Tax=Colletotrichum phormii TaxID=359342 RepID=A0AAJ0EBM9_9PEZI|nr:methyltransferase domain-containing protein [Colletotrichum phormii]KAK1623868.1 methyltransferase domain-containing protein [Colletotrichum phormii]